MTDADYTLWADHYGAGLALAAANRLEAMMPSLTTDDQRVDLLTLAGEYSLRDDQVGIGEFAEAQDVLQDVDAGWNLQYTQNNGA